MVVSGFIGPPGTGAGLLFYVGIDVFVDGRGLPPPEDQRRIRETSMQFNEWAGKTRLDFTRRAAQRDLTED
jgi:hypothetical protein